MATTTASVRGQLPPLTGRESEDRNRAPVGIPGGNHFARQNGVEEQHTRNVDGTAIYRVTKPIANPQEAAIAARGGQS